MITSATASIHRQNDTKFIQDIHIHMSNILDIYKNEISNDITDVETNLDKLDKYAKRIKKSLLAKELSIISKILYNRFNVKITVDNLTMKDMKLSSLIMPNLNNKVLNMAMADINSLFPKKNLSETLWSTTANINEVAIYKTLSNISNAMSNNKLSIDLDKAKVYGLDNSNFIVNIDFIKVYILSITPEEVTTLLLYEVGRIFAYLEYMSISTNNTLTLLDTFINEKFSKSNTSIDSLVVAMNTTVPDYKIKNKNIMILEELDIFMLKTFNIDNNKGIKIDFSRIADIFVTRFGLANDLTSLLTKRATDGIVTIDMKNNFNPNNFLDNLIDIIGYTFLILSFVLILTMGLLFLIVYTTIKIIKFILNFIFKSIINIFSSIFKEKNIKDFDDVFSRLKKIKIELIRELRTLKLNSESKLIITEDIEFINDAMKALSENVHTLNKYGYIPNNLDEELKINDIIESLQDSELYFNINKLEKINN